jgi:hypothetical protein
MKTNLLQAVYGSDLYPPPRKCEYCCWAALRLAPTYGPAAFERLRRHGKNLDLMKTGFGLMQGGCSRRNVALRNDPKRGKRNGAICRLAIAAQREEKRKRNSSYKDDIEIT